EGVISDPQSSPFVSTGGRIVHLVGHRQAELLADTGGRPAGLAFSPSGDLFVADPGRKAVLKISSAGEIAVWAERCGATPFSAPTRLAMAPDGSLFVSDAQTSQICRVDARGRSAIFASNFRGATGLVFSAATGHLFAAGRDRKIWRFGADGQHRKVFAEVADDVQTGGLALDEKGNFYIACSREVRMFGPDGRQRNSYPLPGGRATDVALGGPGLRTLYVTADTGVLYKLRVPHRSQRLPWEDDAPLRIVEPVDGAVLNRHDGENTPEGLRIAVKGTFRGTGPVLVDGKEVPVRGGTFETSMLLRERETLVRVEAPGDLHREITLFWDRDSFPRYRISTDDNILFLKDIAEHAGTYGSIFDNAYLAFWREVHRKYGSKVHFNIYYETPGFRLSQMPEKFRREWQANASWIRLTFHARANDPDRPYLHASAERVRQDYRLVTREIARFAGPELQSPVTTVHWGALQRDAAKALRAEGVRCLVGYFEEHEEMPIVAYYLPYAQWRYLGGRDYWKDTREDLWFVRHDIVLNLFSPAQIIQRLEQIAADPHQAEVIELMIHEQYFYPDYRAYEPDYRERVERAVEWVTRRGYRPVFYGDGFLGTARN
ncbi:MAG TPA: SMP-30/gluconolactonase/LRE family protein, partial [Bryobacteraceae bacterium]|nr:SMP-30/gluconolactonase/LRE family protein [Bryobacteraceae bacterium]